MKRRDRKWRTWETAGLFVVILLGNTLHFVYDWTGQARWAAYVSAVNESTWEHMKLLFVPWLLWTVAQCIGLRSLRPAAPRAVGLLAGMAAIPLLFYGYTGVTGVNVGVVNVLIFQAAVLLAFWVSTALQKRGALTAPVWQAAGVLVMAALCAAFVLWTVSPPALPVFTDPVDGIGKDGQCRRRHRPEHKRRAQRRHDQYPRRLPHRRSQRTPLLQRRADPEGQQHRRLKDEDVHHAHVDAGDARVAVKQQRDGGHTRQQADCPRRRGAQAAKADALGHRPQKPRHEQQLHMLPCGLVDGGHIRRPPRLPRPIIYKMQRVAQQDDNEQSRRLPGAPFPVSPLHGIVPLSRIASLYAAAARLIHHRNKGTLFIFPVL